MYNLQADGLSSALLRSNNPKLYFLTFEPLEIKKSSLKTLKIGSLVGLGKKLPEIYICRKGTVVGQAKLGRIDDKEVIVVSAKERIVNMGKPEAKHLAVEARIAVLPKGSFTVNKLIYLPNNSMENILLFVKGELFAKAALVDCDGEYCLQIREIY